jgi:hypothetical protein
LGLADYRALLRRILDPELTQYELGKYGVVHMRHVAGLPEGDEEAEHSGDCSGGAFVERANQPREKTSAMLSIDFFGSQDIEGACPSALELAAAVS